MHISIHTVYSCKRSDNLYRIAVVNINNWMKADTVKVPFTIIKGFTITVDFVDLVKFDSTNNYYKSITHTNVYVPRVRGKTQPGLPRNFFGCFELDDDACCCCCIRSWRCKASDSSACLIMRSFIVAKCSAIAAS